MTSTRKKIILKSISYFHHLVNFQKNMKTIKILINLSSEINKIIIFYTVILRLQIWFTTVKA